MVASRTSVPHEQHSKSVEQGAPTDKQRANRGGVRSGVSRIRRASIVTNAIPILTISVDACIIGPSFTLASRLSQSEGRSLSDNHSESGKCAPKTRHNLADPGNVGDMDERWRLQRKEVCFDLARFDKVWLFENLESDLRSVLPHLFGEEQ